MFSFHDYSYMGHGPKVPPMDAGPETAPPCAPGIPGAPRPSTDLGTGLDPSAHGPMCHWAHGP